jgi:hypothetical protein
VSWCAKRSKNWSRHTTGQQKAQRARSILKAAEGKNNTELAKELKISVDMAALWRERWLALAAVGLDDLSVEERAGGLTTTRRAVWAECGPTVPDRANGV